MTARSAFNRHELQFRARFVRANTLEGGLSIAGFVLTAASLAMLVGTVGDMLRGWSLPVQPWHALVGLAVGVGAMALGGLIHTRKFNAAAAEGGLSKAEAQALSDEADDLDDE